MAYNTGNPVPSTDAKDFIDNCENIDKAVNSLGPTFQDRLGVTRSTYEGVVQGLSFFNVGTFAAGFTLTNSRQTLTHDGHEYGWSGVFPKTVSAGSTPTPLGSGGWIDRSDVTLREYVVNTTTATFNNEGGYSAVDNMIAGRVNGIAGTVAHNVGNVYSTGGTTWEVVTVTSPSKMSDFKPISYVNAGDFGLHVDGSFFVALDLAIKSADGAQVVVPHGLYNAGSGRYDIISDRINLYFDGVTVLFSGLTSNDINSELWSREALRINAAEELNIDGDLIVDFQNTYVYRGISLVDSSLKTLSGLTVKNIRPPVGWKDYSPGLISSAILLGSPTGAIVKNIRTENTFRYYQDGSDIVITETPPTPLSRCIDVQGSFSNFTIKDCIFKDAMMGLLLDTGIHCVVDNIEINNTLSNAIYDLNGTDIIYRGCRFLDAKDQGITLAGRDKRITGCLFDNVNGRPISLHAGDCHGLIVSNNVCRHSNIAISAVFVAIRTDATNYVRNNVVITGNVINLAQAGYAILDLGTIGNGCVVSGNSFTIMQFPGRDPSNGSVINAGSGVVDFSANSIFYNDGQHLFCFRGDATIKNGGNASNCALATFTPDKLESVLFSNTQKALEGKPCNVEQFGTINMRLPDNIGTKGLGGNYVVAQGDINTFSTYQPATMGAYGFKWANGTNGNYDTVFEVLKPSQAAQLLNAVLRIDQNGNLHLKAGTTIMYDL